MSAGLLASFTSAGWLAYFIPAVDLLPCVTSAMTQALIEPHLQVVLTALALCPVTCQVTPTEPVHKLSLQKSHRRAVTVTTGVSGAEIQPCLDQSKATCSTC